MQDHVALAKAPLAFVALSEEQPRADAHAARVLAIANIKGGVGKTTTTANLSAALAERGRCVLAVDLDPQASLTLSVGIPVRDGDATIGQALASTAAPLGSLQ